MSGDGNDHNNNNNGGENKDDGNDDDDYDDSRTRYRSLTVLQSRPQELRCYEYS